jgi:hypothetical protein
MSHLQSSGGFITILRRAWVIAGPKTMNPSWERELLAEIRAVAETQRSVVPNLEAPIFLRFSFAALALTTIVFGLYQFSFVEERITAQQLIQLDPFDISGALSE